MEKFNKDLTQTLKWLQNEAPNLQALVNSKAKWYEKYGDQFWENWYRDVFDLNTCTEFGIYVWCEILGIPKSLINIEPMTNQFAFGKERQNFNYSGVGKAIPEADRNEVGGNFYGSGQDSISNLNEARILLKLRYAALTSDGRIANINRMLKSILNNDDDWDFLNGKYAFVTDSTVAVGSTVAVTNLMKNPSFEFGLDDWTNNGNVKTLFTTDAKNGSYVLTNKTANTICTITQRMDVPIGNSGGVNYGFWMSPKVGAKLINGNNSFVSIAIFKADGTQLTTNKKLFVQQDFINGYWSYVGAFNVIGNLQTADYCVITLSFECDTAEGFYIDQGRVEKRIADNGYWVVNDWQGRTTQKNLGQWIVLAGGNTWNGNSGSGSPTPVAATVMGISQYYTWSGDIKPSQYPIGTKAVVGGDERQYNGPDYYGMKDLANGEHMPGYSNAIRLIRKKSTQQNPPYTNWPSNEYAYWSTLLRTAPQVFDGVYIEYVIFAKKTSSQVNTIMLKECIQSANNLGVFSDPVRVFVDLATGNYIVRGFNDDSERSKKRAAVKVLDNGWLKIVFREILKYPDSALHNLTGGTAHAVIPLASKYNDPIISAMPIGGDVLIFGYQALMNGVIAEANIEPTDMPWYNYTMAITTANATYRIVTPTTTVEAITLNLFVGCGNGSETALRSGPNSINYSSLQPGANLSFNGQLGNISYSELQPFVTYADGKSITYKYNAQQGIPTPPLTPFSMEYVFGPAFPFSDQFKKILLNRAYGALPMNAGIGTTLAEIKNDLSPINLMRVDIDWRITVGRLSTYGTFASQYQLDQVLGTGNTLWSLNSDGNVTIGRTYPWLGSVEYMPANYRVLDTETTMTGVSGETIVATTVTMGPVGTPISGAREYLFNLTGVSDANKYSYGVVKFGKIVTNGPAGRYIFSITARAAAINPAGKNLASSFDVFYKFNGNLVGGNITPIGTVNLTANWQRFYFEFDAPEGILPQGNLDATIYIGYVNTAKTNNVFQVQLPSAQIYNGYKPLPGVNFSQAAVNIPPISITVLNPGREANGITIYFTDGSTMNLAFARGADNLILPNKGMDWFSKFVTRIEYY